MPGLEDGMQSLVDGLFNQDSSIRLATIRKIKHQIIGNKTKKSLFMVLGVVPRLVSLLGDGSSDSDLIQEAVITLGSFAHGTAENVQAVLAARALPYLAKGILHPSPSVVCCCLRTLRTLYSSSLSPPDPNPVFQDISISRRLVALLSEPHPLAQCAAIVLAKACQSCDHQNLLCAHGAIDQLTTNLLSPIPKLVQASLLCLSSIVRGNKTTAHLVATASCKGHPFISTVLKILSNSHDNQTKVAAAKCLTFLYRSGVVEACSAGLTLKVLPSLVRLSRPDVEISIRTNAIMTLAYLTEVELSLQELAADSDHLVSTLVEYLATPPDPNSDLCEHHMEEFVRLSEAVLLVLASLASHREEIRYKISSGKHMVKSLCRALDDDDTPLKVAAIRCLLSLSRSTKLLRTCLFDHECWRPVLATLMLLGDLESLQVATAACCNLLLPFSPSRERLVEDGVLKSLGPLLEHEDQVVKLNSIWAFMSAADSCSSEVRQEIISVVTYQKIIRLMSPSTPTPLLLKTLGLLVNLTQDSVCSELPSVGEQLLSQQGTELLAAMETLLEESSSSNSSSISSSSGSEVVEQCLCVLVNLSSCSEKVRDILVHRDGIVRSICSILRSNGNIVVLMAAVDIVHNLAHVDKEGHIHRQNCLKEFGASFALQKLEKEENRRLQIHVTETLEHFLK